jgi:hypothetical protein
MGREDMTPLIVKLGIGWKWVVSLTVRSLYPCGQRPNYPFNRRTGGLKSRTKRFGKKKKSFSLAEK